MRNRFHVGGSQAEVLTTFSFCSGDASAGGDPSFTSFDSARIGLGCGDQTFIYESLRLWAEINQCTGPPTTFDEYCESYTQCGDGVETDLCSLPNVDHSPYNNSLGFNVATTAWKVFQRQPMK